MVPNLAPRIAFNTADFLKKSFARSRNEKVVERGEECGVMYTVTRNTLSRKSVVFEFEAKDITLSVRLIAEEEKLKIAEFGFKSSTLEFEFVRRLIWLIFSEAKLRGTKTIEGKIDITNCHLILVYFFRLYGFEITYNAGDYNFYFAL